MPKPLNLGNDIVALTSARCRGKVQDSRFLHRVFSEEEQEAILTSEAPDTMLWLHWAGKEAIFKSSTKALGSPPVFHHHSFRVSLPEGVNLTSNAPLSIRGTGSYEGLLFHLQAELRPAYVHMVAWEVEEQKGRTGGGGLHRQVVQGGDSDTFSEEELRLGLSPEEQACVSHRASALTRLGAKVALAAVLEVEREMVEIRCGPGTPGRRVPSVFLNGEELALDLTLSHDAHLMAWAFFLPERGL